MATLAERGVTSERVPFAPRPPIFVFTERALQSTRGRVLKELRNGIDWFSRGGLSFHRMDVEGVERFELPSLTVVAPGDITILKEPEGHERSRCGYFINGEKYGLNRIFGQVMPPHTGEGDPPTSSIHAHPRAFKLWEIYYPPAYEIPGIGIPTLRIRCHSGYLEERALTPGSQPIVVYPGERHQVVNQSPYGAVTLLQIINGALVAAEQLHEHFDEL